MKLFVVGMPASGKTSYIARLCIQLLSRRDTIYKLKGVELPKGLENIQNAISSLTQYEEIARTLKTALYNIVFPLESENGGEILLDMPDLSGENYSELVEKRYITKELYQNLQEADELLFFINTDMMEREERISLNEETVAKKLHDDENSTEEGPNIIQPKATQTQVVELLQLIVALTKKKLKIKFVISAWDSMEKKYGAKIRKPEECLQSELPLLYQYIVCNTERMDYQVFGVSAQGMEYADAGKVDELLDTDENIEDMAVIVMPDGEKYQDMSRLFG